MPKDPFRHQRRKIQRRKNRKAVASRKAQAAAQAKVVQAKAFTAAVAEVLASPAATLAPVATPPVCAPDSMDYTDYSYSELQAACKALGVSAGGSRKALVKRLSGVLAGTHEVTDG